MIHISAPALDHIEQAARAAYPAECCGLLVGIGDAEKTMVITRVVASRNLRAQDRTDRFEIDPKVRFDTMRALDGTSERIVGHYHSHPDHPARPSATDLASAWEPEMVWLITAVTTARVQETTAHILGDDRTHFRPLSLTTDPAPHEFQ